MAWLGCRLKCGPAQHTDETSRDTGRVRGSGRRPHFFASVYPRNHSRTIISIFRDIDVNYPRVHSASVWQISVETSCISLLDCKPNPDSATA